MSDGEQRRDYSALERKPDWTVTVRTPGKVEQESKATKALALSVAKAAMKAAKCPIYVLVRRGGYMLPNGDGTLKLVSSEVVEFGRWEDVYPEG